ncbi:MAG: hypothetical protein R3Y21_05335, partial [Mycoplasmatota bacterium]
SDYVNEYETQILDREDDEAYKIIEFEINGENAYLAVIYDPSTISDFMKVVNMLLIWLWTTVLALQ